MFAFRAAIGHDGDQPLRARHRCNRSPCRRSKLPQVAAERTSSADRPAANQCAATQSVQAAASQTPAGGASRWRPWLGRRNVMAATPRSAATTASASGVSRKPPYARRQPRAAKRSTTGVPAAINLISLLAGLCESGLRPRPGRPLRPIRRIANRLVAAARGVNNPLQLRPLWPRL